MKTTATLAAVAAYALALTPGMVCANIVVNGGFETGNFSGWTQHGDTSFSDVHASAAYTGSYGVRFGPIFGVGGIYQDLPTTPGLGYDLSFYLSNLAHFTPNSFGVSVGGAPIASLSLANSGDFPYTEFTASFVAAGVVTRLQFDTTNPPGYWLLDDVSVTAVPEPGQVAMGLVLLVGAAGYAYRRRQAARA